LKIKALIPIIVIGFVIAFAYHFIALADIDAPHNQSNEMGCGSCHDEGLLQAYWGGSGLYSTSDALCFTKCHWESSCGVQYPSTSGPHVEPHLDSDDNVVAGCVDCHNPHEQRQKVYKNTDASNLYLANGTITSCVYNGDVTSTLTFSDLAGEEITYKPGWDASKLVEKSGDCRQAILFPNIKKLGYSYTIIGIDEVAKTITVEGDATKAYQYIDPPTDFAVLYGQYIKDIINGKPVKFFDQTGTNSFSDGDGEYNGVCEICHTQTSHFWNNGLAPDQNHENAGGLAATNCINCHSHQNSFGVTGSHGVHGSIVECNVCHEGEDFTDLPPDVIPGSGYSFTYDDNTNTCSGISCHFDTDATWGESACTGCHSTNVDSNRVNVMDQFDGNSHHIQGPSVEGIHCYECHWEANENGLVTPYHEYNTSESKVDLVSYGDGTRPVTYTAGTTAIQYMADGSRAEFERLNDHCISCHSDQNDATEPFGDGKTPKEYAWDNSSIDARYSQAGTTIRDKYARTWNPRRGANKNQTKSYSAHGNAVDNEGGWNLEVGPYRRHNSRWYEMYSDYGCWNIEEGGDDAWPNTRNGSENILCFDCHNSHGSSIEGVTTSYTSTTTNGGILKDTEAGKGSYSMGYKPQDGGLTEDKNAYNAGAGLCFDCHLTETSGDTPWGYNDTFGADEPIMGDRDTPYFGPGISGAQLRYAYKQVRTHQGGHFGASSPMTTSVEGSINGLCTPCHDPHGVSTSIIQEYAVPLLKGTWMTSLYQDDRASETSEMGPRRGGKFSGAAPVGCCVAGDCPGFYWPIAAAAKEPGYRIDQNTLQPVSDFWWQYSYAARISESNSQFGGLCLQCHAQSQIDADGDNAWESMDRIHDTVKGWGANTMHSFPCSKCHTPHSSRLPRLMITNCLDYNHNGRVYSGGKAVSYEYKFTHSGGMNAGGQGAGRFPAGGGGRGYTDNPFNPWNGDGFPGDYKYGFGYGYKYFKCHQDTNPGSWPDRELWNTVTRWEEIAISSGPSADSLTAVGQHEMATINWKTEALWTPGGFASTSCVDYGLTENYGSTICTDDLVTDHTIVINMFYNYTTYHYRVRSETPDGIEAVSEDNTFYISVPPTVPDLIDEPDNECAAPCSVTLEWNPSIDSDNDPIEYKVKAVKASDSSIFYESDWILGNCIDSICSWEVPALLTPDIDTSWWWVVWARNAEHTWSVTDWPISDFFRVVPEGDTSRRPTRPYPIDEPDNECGDVSCPVTLAWHPSTNPTGGALEYMVQVDNDWWFYSPDYVIAWTPDETATTEPIPTDANTKWYWRVKARGVDTGLESFYSTKDSFKVVPLLPPASPPAPFLIAEPDFDSGDIDTDITLRWDPVTDPEGHSVEYLVEVDNNPNFIIPNYSSGWDSAESYDITVAPCTKWWWRVKARDAVDEHESQWSLTDNFMDTSNSCTTVVDESFEETKSVEDGYDDAPWTETVDNITCPNCILDPDSAMPGTTLPPNAGSECLKAVSAGPDYIAYTTIDYGLEQSKTFTSFYLYVEEEDLVENSGKYIAAFQDSADNYVFTFRLYRLSGQLLFNLRIYNNGAMVDYGFNAVVSLNTWHKIDIKYDNTNDTWEWKFDGVVQDSGGLTGSHYTGLQKWFLGFADMTQQQTGTIYFDLFTVNTLSYME
jgi:hypothetical protein